MANDTVKMIGINGNPAIAVCDIQARNEIDLLKAATGKLLSDIYVPYGKSRNIVFDFGATNRKGLKFKKDTSIRLTISEGGTPEHRWHVQGADYFMDCSADMQTVADASGTRTGQIHGRDFYLYLVPNGTDGTKIVLSANSTFPNDVDPTYTANNTRKIGQFHTLCEGIPENDTRVIPVDHGSVAQDDTYVVKNYFDVDDDGFHAFYTKRVSAVETLTQYDVATVPHTLAGFNAGDILPESVFSLSFRPNCPCIDGMVYDVDSGACPDIYLQSGKGRNTKSVFHGVTTRNRQQVNHVNDFMQVGKRCLFDREFFTCMLGSNEKTVIKTVTEAAVVNTGGHVDTADKRMVSFIGVEDGCGAIWQWLDTTSAYGGSGEVVYDGHGKFGDVLGDYYALLAGGYWGDGADAGSRARNGSATVSTVNVVSGGRGAAPIVKLVG